jgi:hypothetical protein
MKKFRRSGPHSKIFFGGRKDYFRVFEFWRIAVPAVSDNRASRLLEFRYGDEISGKRSGTLRARSGAGCSSYAASRLLEFRYGDEISGKRSGTLRARSGAGCSSYAAISASRLLAQGFRHADVTGITTRHSGRAPSDAAGTAALRAGNPRGAVRT